MQCFPQGKHSKMKAQNSIESFMIFQTQREEEILKGNMWIDLSCDGRCGQHCTRKAKNIISMLKKYAVCLYTFEMSRILFTEI